MKTHFLIPGLVLCLIGLIPTVGCSNEDDPTGGDEGNSGGETTETPGNNGSADNNGDSDNSGSSDDGSGWTLVFEDDFENESGTPDTSKWSLCERGTSNWARYLSESYDQAYVSDGSLHLIGEKVDGEYKTGGIETRGKFDFQYGKVECRARFATQPQGGHTGIWMMPAPPAETWPKSGEIDIMEHLDKDKLIYETIHSWYCDDMDKTDPAPQGKVDVDNEEWNTYGVIWTADSITFTVNGEKYLSYPNLKLSNAQDAAYQWPFDHPFYLILSQSLGGEGTWAGEIDDSELPAVFEIDWIKVYQQQSED